MGTDAELLEAARSGDEGAFTELYSRHHSVALRVAASYPRAGAAEELVNEAFTRILSAINRGVGPTEAFRAYLLVTLRRLAADRIARTREDVVGELPEAPAPGGLELDERQLVVAAYEALPDRWRAVLWATEVEGRKRQEIAAELGITANAVSALAYRAREKLRQAYLQAHLQAAPCPACDPYRRQFGAYVRAALAGRERAAVAAHLAACPACRSLLVELENVNGHLVRSMVPVFSAGSVGAGIVGHRALVSAVKRTAIAAGLTLAAAAALALALVGLR